MLLLAVVAESVDFKRDALHRKVFRINGIGNSFQNRSIIAAFIYSMTMVANQKGTIVLACRVVAADIAILAFQFVYQMLFEQEI